MKITVHAVDGAERRRLIADGKISKCPLTLIYDKVRLDSLLGELVGALKRDPGFNVREAVENTFSRCPRYQLTDDKKMLYGVETELPDNGLKVDITQTFVELVERQVRAQDADAEHLAQIINDTIKERWGY